MTKRFPFVESKEDELPSGESFHKKDETPQEVVVRILEEHGNMESNIPVNHPEYWQAKINNNPNK